MKEKRKDSGIIRDWNIVDGQVHGKLYGSSWWKEQFNVKEGEPIRTSLIENVTVETQNTIYKLDPYSGPK